MGDAVDEHKRRVWTAVGVPESTSQLLVTSLSLHHDITRHVPVTPSINPEVMVCLRDQMVSISLLFIYIVARVSNVRLQVDAGGLNCRGNNLCALCITFIVNG